MEAHGTGTSLGDPIELRALASVFSGAAKAACHSREETSDQPVVIGSAKASIGHLESVSGIAGLIKTIMVLRHLEAPPQIHFDKLNPEIEKATRNFNFRIITHDTPASERVISPRGQKAYTYGIVSSFGFSGTNASVVLASPSLSCRDADSCTPLRGQSFPLTMAVRGHPLLTNSRQKWVDVSSTVKVAYMNIGNYTTVFNQLKSQHLKSLTHGDGAFFPFSILLELLLATAVRAYNGKIRGRFRIIWRGSEPPLSRRCLFLSPDPWALKSSSMITL